MINEKLSTRDFERLSNFIYDTLGIKMPESKILMLQGRLSKRLRALGLSDFADYCHFLFSPRGQQEELVHLINAVTTNKTDFFREPSHFDYLVQTAVPTLKNLNGYEERQKITLWSAGCSTGEEPYTLAMVLAELQARESGFTYEILATDVSTKVLGVARRAVYPMERITPIDSLLRKKYLLRGKDRNNPQIRIVPELRKKIRFGKLNFMDKDFGLPTMVNIIFCRNVIIYFDKKTQKELMAKFCQYLHQGGYLFLGHSESLQGFDTPLSQVAPTVYRKLH